MSMKDRSPSPQTPPRDEDIEMDNGVPDKPTAKVVVVTNLTRNVVEAHLQTIFGFYGKILKIDIPMYGKSGQNRGKAAVEYFDSESAHKAATHMDGGQLDGAVLKIELSDLPVRSRSRSPRPRARNGRDETQVASATLIADPMDEDSQYATHTAHIPRRAPGRRSEEVDWVPGGGHPATSVEGTAAEVVQGLRVTRCAQVAHVHDLYLAPAPVPAQLRTLRTRDTAGVAVVRGRTAGDAGVTAEMISGIAVRGRHRPPLLLLLLRVIIVAYAYFDTASYTDPLLSSIP
ncbi:hypothetical protein EVG20_g910 [Dentipellis fragilis]|uniref:RRM domain-containing protein n=1 Tax=Dentipellis fragilis TaxID=205917 RepID=A0A4Y9ZBD4_9AGAM|nr:hypothetical protein EVG20_g910 [Dentipellis fragilis]